MSAQSYGTTILAPQPEGGAPKRGWRPDRRLVAAGVVAAVLLAAAAGAWAAGLGPFSSTAKAPGPAPAGAAVTAFENLPPAQIVAAAAAAGNAAGSAHFVVRDVVTGQPGQSYISDAGATSGRQLMAVGAVTAEIRVIGGVVYLKASNAFLHQPFTKMTAADALRLAEHWILVRPGDAPYAAIAAGVTFASAFDELTDGFIGTLTKTTVKTLTGRELVRVCGTGTHGEHACLYVDPTSHLVDHQTATLGGASETVTISQWGARVIVAAPAGATALASLHH
jgi:hypothetical protein